MVTLVCCLFVGLFSSFLVYWTICSSAYYLLCSHVFGLSCVHMHLDLNITYFHNHPRVQTFYVGDINASPFANILMRSLFFFILPWSLLSRLTWNRPPVPFVGCSMSESGSVRSSVLPLGWRFRWWPYCSQLQAPPIHPLDRRSHFPLACGFLPSFGGDNVARCRWYISVHGSRT